MEFLVLTDIHDDWAHLGKILDLAGESSGVIFLGDLMQYGKVAPRSLDNFLRIHDATEWMAAVPGNGALPEVVQFMSDIGVNVHGTSKRFEEIGFFGVGGVTDAVEVVHALRQYLKENRRPAISLHAKSIETLNAFGVFIRDGFFEVEDWPPEKLQQMEKYRSPFEHTESELFNILLCGHEPIRDLPVRVLLSHVPPYEEGMNPNLPEGVSTGSRAMTRFIHEYRPSLVLSGHYHRDHRFTVGSVPCAVLPAVKDGYYSLLRFDQNCGQFKLEVRMF